MEREIGARTWEEAEAEWQAMREEVIREREENDRKWKETIERIVAPAAGNAGCKR